jgi:hypothetical protein
VAAVMTAAMILRVRDMMSPFRDGGRSIGDVTPHSGQLQDGVNRVRRVKLAVTLAVKSA